MQFKFCPECGEKLITKTIGDEGETSFCENCGRPWFSFSYPCVICLLTDGAGKYALIRQTYATRNYVCVAGFIKEHETRRADRSPGDTRGNRAGSPEHAVYQQLLLSEAR